MAITTSTDFGHMAEFIASPGYEQLLKHVAAVVDNELRNYMAAGQMNNVENIYRAYGRWQGAADILQALQQFRSKNKVDPDIRVRTPLG